MRVVLDTIDTPLTEMPPHDLLDALREILELYSLGVPRSVRVLGKRQDYVVLQLTTADAEFITKLAGPESSEPSFERASAGHSLALRATKVPMADIIAVDDTMTRAPFRFLVQSKISGEQWISRRQRLTPQEQQDALCGIARTVAELHSFRVAGYGQIRDDGHIDSEPFAPAIYRHVARIIAAPRLRDRLHELIDKRSGLFAASPRSGITHEDLHGLNILFDLAQATKVAAIVDFDKAWVGPVESDLARMELWDGVTSPFSLAVYHERIAMDEGYEERRTIYQLAWCYEFALNSTKHLITTNTLERQLGIPVLKTFAGVLPSSPGGGHPSGN